MGGVSDPAKDVNQMPAKCPACDTALQETVLKIPSTASVSDPAINQLTIVAIAQIRYLQEYTNLLVSNEFDDSTAQLFKTLQQNPAAFTAGAVESLQRAVTIAGARQVSHAASYGRVTE